MPDLTQLIALGSIVYTVVNIVRYWQNTDFSSVLSQALAWVAGILATIVVAHTGLAAAFTFGGRNLAQVGLGSQILVGLAAASSIGIVYQFKRAVDSGDSAKVPSLKVPSRLTKQDGQTHSGS